MDPRSPKRKRMKWKLAVIAHSPSHHPLHLKSDPPSSSEIDLISWRVLKRPCLLYAQQRGSEMYSARMALVKWAAHRQPKWLVSKEKTHFGGCVELSPLACASDFHCQCKTHHLKVTDCVNLITTSNHSHSVLRNQWVVGFGFQPYFLSA